MRTTKLSKIYMLTVGVLVMGAVGLCACGGVLLRAIVSFVVTKGADLGASLVLGKRSRFRETREMVAATPLVNNAEY